MPEQIELVRDHYQAGIPDHNALLVNVSAALDGMEGPITAERLASFDQFHVGGLGATAEMARRIGVTGELRVLDAGSGLGGPSRYLAETFGCHVIGVDLAPAYVRVAALLADRAGLSDKVTYHVGSITDLPFEDASFDLVWTQHVVMNVQDRDQLYKELRRVLKAGASFAFYDPYVPDDGQPPYYPTPWAETASASTLLTRGETVAALNAAGFSIRTWDDVSEPAKGWIAQQQQRMQQAAESGSAVRDLSPGLVVGPRMQPMVANFSRNILEGRVRLVMGLCEAA